jgi:hypothetical protein
MPTDGPCCVRFPLPTPLKPHPPTLVDAASRFPAHPCHAVPAHYARTTDQGQGRRRLAAGAAMVARGGAGSGRDSDPNSNIVPAFDPDIEPDSCGRDPDPDSDVVPGLDLNSDPDSAPCRGTVAGPGSYLDINPDPSSTGAPSSAMHSHSIPRSSTLSDQLWPVDEFLLGLGLRSG